MREENNSPNINKQQMKINLTGHSSLFETDKEIQEAIEDEYQEIYKNAVSINKRELVKILKCFLCGGIFRTPMTINECMHTFCKGCIYKHFYSTSGVTKDFCPQCGIKLGGRPIDTLIFDNTISLLVDILFPEFEAIDKENSKKMFTAFRENNEQLPGDEEEIKNSKPTIPLYLYPLKSDDMLPEINSPSIIVQKNMDIQAMKKYLETKIHVDQQEIEVYYKGHLLPSNYTIGDVDNKFGFDQEQTVFNYKRAIGSGNDKGKGEKEKMGINKKDNINNDGS